MRIIRTDWEEKTLKVEPQTLEDLWQLSKLVEPGDFVEGRSWRAWRPPGREGRAGPVEKKSVHLRVEVEQVEFATAVNKLRVTGIIRAGTPEEFVSTGEHHTLDVEGESVITIVKKEVTAYHHKLVEEARKRAKAIEALILTMDEKKASLHKLTLRGLEHLFEMDNEIDKRLPPARNEELQKKYYADILNTLERSTASRIVVAGPGFAAEDFLKYLKRKDSPLLAKTSLEHCSTAEQSGATELLKNGLLQKLIGEIKLEEEFAALEEVKTHLGRSDGLTVTGWTEVRKAVDARAANLLIILDSLLRNGDPAEGITREQAGHLINDAEQAGAKLMIFEEENAAGQELKGFKLAAVLRYRLTYT